MGAVPRITVGYQDVSTYLGQQSLGPPSTADTSTAPARVLNIVLS